MRQQAQGQSAPVNTERRQNTGLNVKKGGVGERTHTHTQEGVQPRGTQTRASSDGRGSNYFTAVVSGFPTSLQSETSSSSDMPVNILTASLQCRA